MVIMLYSCIILNHLVFEACDGNANQFIDEVIQNAKQVQPNDIRLPDVNDGKYRIIFI